MLIPLGIITGNDVINHLHHTNPFHLIISPSIPQSNRQPQKTRIRSHRQRRQHNHHIPTRPKLLLPQPILPNLGKKLLIPLLPPQQARQKNAGTVDGEEGADGVELGGEDLEDDEREGELAEGGADVGAFEGALGGADFDEFFVCEDDGAGAVHAEVVGVGRVWLGDISMTLEVSE